MTVFCGLALDCDLTEEELDFLLEALALETDESGLIAVAATAFAALGVGVKVHCHFPSTYAQD